MTSFNRHNQTVPLREIIAPEVTPLGKELFAIGLAGMPDETQRLLAEANEGVDHRMSPEDVDEYERALERAQRKIGVRPFLPANDGPF